MAYKKGTFGPKRETFNINLTLAEELRPLLIRKSAVMRRHPRDCIRIILEDALGYKPRIDDPAIAMEGNGNDRRVD